MISEASVRRAIDHLGSFGDTDLFPRLPEMRCFLERPGIIAKDCRSLNIGQFMPVGVVEDRAPQRWLRGQAATAGRLTVALSLTDPSVSRVM
jgi:hypothetical protein